MKKILASLIIVFTLVACSANTVNMIADAKKGIVSIVAEKNAEGIQPAGNGLGTGFIIAENTIVTNYHVAGNSKSLKIAFATADDFYDAEFVFGDEASDVAVIKLKDWDKFIKENPDYRVMKFANYVPKDGSEVYVIGHPWGLLYSVSKGIVSLSMRKSPNTIPTWWIQTDAHVYNGNSGGPMLNEDGEVLGMNSVMVSNEGGSYGFALPATLIKKIINDLKTYNEVRWATIGITMKSPGVTVNGIDPTGPASKSTLQVNDKIVGLEVDDRKIDIHNSLDIISALSLIDYKSPIKLVVERDDSVIKVYVEPSFKLSNQFPKE